MKLTRITMAIAATFGTIGIAGMPLAFADENVDQTNVVPQKVVVTGSLLKRIAGETSLPVQVISKQDIERSGATTALELLSTISTASSSGNTNPASSTFSGNVMTGASLRGMGYQRTLVLLNGRRIANNAFDGGGVDLETIPLTAIDHVEVLMDGASAVYGADAVGGVINFILAKNFQGVEATLYGTDTQHGGASGQRATLTLGTGDLASDHYNAFITLDARHDNPLAAADRPFASTYMLPPIYGAGRTYYLSAHAFPGNAYTYGPDPQNPQYAVANPGSPDCSAPNLTAVGDGSCLYDGGASGNVIPLADKLSAVSRFTYKPDNATEYFVEASLSNNSYTLPTTPTFAQGESTAPDGTFPGYVPFQIFPNSPYYPTAFAMQNGVNGQPIDFISLLSELGPTITKTTNQQQRLVIGTNGSIWGWDYDTAINLNRATSDEHYLTAIIDTQAFYNLTLSGLYNPFGPQSPAGLAALQATQWSGESRNATMMIKSWDLKLTKSLFQLPAGTVDVAVGTELRKESLSQTYGDHYALGYLLNFGGTASPANPSPRTIKSLSAEVNIPILKGLETDISVRDDNYSSFGNTINPKASFRWQPTQSLLFRGSWGTGFRAPNLVDVSTPLAFAAGTSFSDPIRCPGGVPVPGANPSYDCNNPFMQAHYGNPNLQPEKSIQSTIGVMYEPTKQITLGLNYFRIDLSNVLQIAGLPPNLAFDPATATQYASMLVRGPIDPNAPNLPGPIQYINVPSLNEGEWNVRGLDVNAEYRFAPTSVGKFAVKMDGTYYRTFDISMPGNPTIGTVGQQNQLGQGVLNRWHHYLSLNWVKEAWDVTLAQTYLSGYRDQNSYAFFGTNLPGYPRVASYSLFDLTGQYKLSKNWIINGGIKNLFDRDPPFSNISAVTSGYDPSYADPRGRAFWLSVTYSLR